MVVAAWSSVGSCGEDSGIKVVVKMGVLIAGRQLWDGPSVLFSWARGILDNSDYNNV